MAITAEQNAQAIREMRGAEETPPSTGCALWDRIVSRCPKCHHSYPHGKAHESCGSCGFIYEDEFMLLDRLYLEINALGGAPFDGPYNAAIGHALNVLRANGAVDVETERR